MILVLLLVRFLFQSTLPLRGATYTQTELENGILISIHAPLTGSDMLVLTRNVADYISIHAPLTGSDKTMTARARPRIISIHAPLTGSDIRCILYTPYGERQQDCTKFYLGFCLSSTIL